MVQGRMTRLLPGALLLLCVLALSVPAAAADVGALVDKVVAAHGGEPALRGVAALRQRGTLTSLRTGTSGPVERLFRRPDRFRIDIRQPGQPPEVRVLAGAAAFKNGVPAQPPLLQSIVLQALRFDLPLLLLLRRGEVQDGGSVVAEDGRSLRALVLPLGDDMSLAADIDPATGRMERSRGTLRMGGQSMEFMTIYADWRPLAGVLVAFEEAHHAMGMYTGSTRLDSVEINPDLPDAAFLP